VKNKVVSTLLKIGTSRAFENTGGILMNPARFFCLFALFIFLAGPVYAHGVNEHPESAKPASQNTSVENNISKDIAQVIVGKWEMAPNKRASKGSITFEKNGNYEMHEQLQDGVGVGTKGQFILNSNVTPATLDLCLEECGRPGSEWTTRFGIIRFLSDGKLEIYTSPDDKHPSDFSDDTSGKSTMILTRAKE
jgi:hypothetical protein